MDWEIILSSLILSLIILFPLCMKWNISVKVSLSSSLVIGLLTGFLVSGIERIYYLKYFQSIILQFFLILSIFASFLVWRFYRNPRRIPPEGVNIILSPADGKVTYVKKYDNGAIPFSEKKGKKFLLSDFIQSDALPKEGYIIGITQNFLDVHVNRAPMDGHVAVIHHIKGRFISLRKEEAVILNERALTVLDNGNFKLGVVQIASRLVRQIVVYFKEGQEVRGGQKLGMIRFGSQVDLILPSLPPTNIEIKPGYHVKAGVSIVARITGDSQIR